MSAERPAIPTRVGHTGGEELHFWGRRVFADLLGETTAAQMLVCGITGRLLAPEEMLVIDDIVTAMSSADPRLWPFKITRLASAYGSAAYGVGATMVASQGALFGANRFQAIAEAVTELQRLAADQRLSDDELATLLRGGMVGFGILYGRHDARFDALVGQAEKRGWLEKPFAAVARQAARVSREQLNNEPHVFVAVAALCLDLGMTPHQVGMVGLILLFHDCLANAAEGARQQPIALQQLQEHQVKYVGRAPRLSPRRAHQSS